MILKLSLSKYCAGRGTEKNIFNTLEKIPDIIDAESSDSHILGAATKKTAKNDINIILLPSWVRLCCSVGSCDRCEFSQKNTPF